MQGRWGLQCESGQTSSKATAGIGIKFWDWQPGVPVNTCCVPGLSGKEKQIQAAGWIHMEIGYFLQTCCLWRLLNDI